MSVSGLGANPAYSLQSIEEAQARLQLLGDQASSGNRIVNASIDPSGLAIYNNLTAQAQGADTANLNITDVSDAVNVAQGATSTIQTALSQVNNLAIEANNGFNSPSDDAALQAQANQQIQEINQIAGGTNFNGTPLLDGTNSGNTAPTAAAAQVTNNNAVGAGGGVLASATSSATTTSGTFSVQVDANGNADVTYTDSATQVTTSVGSFAAGSSTTFNGTTLNFGNFTSSDAGQSATVQTTAGTAGSTAPTVSVQSGASAGQTTNVSLPSATTAGLGILSINLSSAANATNAEGQLSGAITALGNTDASLGAQSDALAYAFQNNNVLSVNTTAAASAIGSDNIAQNSVDTAQTQLLQQISINVLAQANNDNLHLNAYLSTYA